MFVFLPCAEDHATNPSQKVSEPLVVGMPPAQQPSTRVSFEIVRRHNNEGEAVRRYLDGAALIVATTLLAAVDTAHGQAIRLVARRR